MILLLSIDTHRIPHHNAPHLLRACEGCILTSTRPRSWSDSLSSTSGQGLRADRCGPPGWDSIRVLVANESQVGLEQSCGIDPHPGEVTSSDSTLWVTHSSKGGMKGHDPIAPEAEHSRAHDVQNLESKGRERSRSLRNRQPVEASFLRAWSRLFSIEL